MNVAMVLKNLGTLLICEVLAMIPSMIVSWIYQENAFWAFLSTIVIMFIIGMSFFFIDPKCKNIYIKEGFAIVAIGWILMSFFGAFPFYLSGSIPSFVDSFFEASSGFTTTGASILTEIEGLSKGILFWRSFTHWIGGMGVLVLALAILPSAGAQSMQMMKAESPGPNPGRLVPKVKETAKILYGIYLLITLTEFILLKLTGLPVYDALVHTFGTVGTGGFSSKNLSVGAYNNIAAEVIITVFMLICGANFSLYYQGLKGNIKGFFKDDEFKFYVLIVTSAIVLITLNLRGTIYHSLKESLRFAAFQVASIISTTGYATADFDVWPVFSKTILFFLMFVGGCAGSTGGGMKHIRILLLFKAAKRSLLKIIHPKAVDSVRIGGRAVNEQTLSDVLAFFFIYFAIFGSAILIISLEGKSMMTTISSVVATMSNIGPGFEMVGPTGNFSSFSVLSKLVLSFCMIVGRLEIYPLLLLMTPKFWAK